VSRANFLNRLIIPCTLCSSLWIKFFHEVYVKNEVIVPLSSSWRQTAATRGMRPARVTCCPKEASTNSDSNFLAQEWFVESAADTAATFKRRHWQYIDTRVTRTDAWDQNDSCYEAPHECRHSICFNLWPCTEPGAPDVKTGTPWPYSAGPFVSPHQEERRTISYTTIFFSRICSLKYTLLMYRYLETNKRISILFYSILTRGIPGLPRIIPQVSQVSKRYAEKGSGSGLGWVDFDEKIRVPLESIHF
jgi:hypothetical protein